jgi:hypothetical protein
VSDDGQVRTAYQSDGQGRATDLDPETPLTFSVFALISPNQPVTFTYADPQQAGKVLWNFHIDRTERRILFWNLGFHNSYSGNDAKATDTFFHAAKDAHDHGRLDQKWRATLRRFLPSLSADDVWTNFDMSAANPENETTWLMAMREHGWQAAAFVMEGSLLDVDHFRITTVNKLIRAALV